MYQYIDRMYQFLTSLILISDRLSIDFNMFGKTLYVLSKNPSKTISKHKVFSMNTFLYNSQTFMFLMYVL